MKLVIIQKNTLHPANPQGSKMGDLTLSYSTGDGTLTSLFSASGSQGSEWKLAEVVLPMDAVSLTLKGHTGVQQKEKTHGIQDGDRHTLLVRKTGSPFYSVRGGGGPEQQRRGFFLFLC